MLKYETFTVDYIHIVELCRIIGHHLQGVQIQTSYGVNAFQNINR